jgi:hypothetical protein
MSAGGCSLAGRRDNVPCLAIRQFSACLHAVVSSALEGGYTAAFEGPSKQLYTSFSAFLHALATSALTLNAARACLVHALALSEFKIFILNFHFIACPCFERP